MRSWDAVQIRASLGDTASALMSLSCAATTAVDCSCRGALLLMLLSRDAATPLMSHTCDKGVLSSCERLRLKSAQALLLYALHQLGTLPPKRILWLSMQKRHLGIKAAPPQPLEKPM